MSDWKQQLIQAAINVSKIAYCPYSNYQVGAALLVKGTQEKPVIFEGCNVENAAYPNGSCAEKSAISHAVSKGAREFDAVAVVTKDGGSPCGSCRQVLNEFNPKMIIIQANQKGEVLLETTLDKLLPGAFGPQNLGK